VLAGRLGAQFLELQGRPWVFGNDGPQPARNLCTLFPQTGYNMCSPFSSYWSERGGLERFGYPISPPIQERIEGRTYFVQYFERRRMEYHPENAGTPYEILLGLLGRDVLSYTRSNLGVRCNQHGPTFQRTWEGYARDLGCGSPYGGENVGIATQRFERGAMLWLPRGDGSPGQIFVIVDDPAQGRYWEIYIDSYVEGESESGEQPPPGLFTPVRGFGKLWRTAPQVREALGWAVEPERGDTGSALQFSTRGGLSWMLYRSAADRIYILRANDGSMADVPRR
jgi:hypothetical protein